MKKSPILCALSLTAVAMSVAIGAKSHVAAHAEVLTNEASSWVNNAGGQTVTATDEGVYFENFGGYGATSRYAEKVKLDGLSFKIYGNGTNNKQNSVYGFYFNGEVESGVRAQINQEPVFSIWEGMYGSQVRWQIGASYDRDSETRTYASIDATTYSGLTGVPAGVSSWNAEGNNGYQVSFEQVNSSWYKVTLTDIFSQFWYSQSGVVLEGGDSSNKTCTRYIKASQINGLDSDGKCYLYVYGASMADGVAQPCFNITNLESNPAYVAGDAIDTAKEKALETVTESLASYDQDDYSEATWAAILNEVESVKTAINAAESVAAVNELVEGFSTYLAACEKMEVTINDGWTCTRGSDEALKSYTSAESVRIKNLHAYSAEMVKEEKVVLDGLSMTFGSTGNTVSNAIGFYFGQNRTYDGYKGAVFSLWHGLYGSQTRFVVGESHDYNAASVAHIDKSMSSKLGFDVATSLVMNKTDHDLTNVSFEHISTQWWKVKFTSSNIWGSNANYNAEEKSSTVYVPASYFELDENGATYLHVFGASNDGGAAIIKNFVNGTLKEIVEDPATAEQVAATKNELNNIDLSEFPTAIEENLQTIINKAVEACDKEGITPGGLETIVNNAKSEMIRVYREYMRLDSEVYDDNTANFRNCSGTNKAIRYDDNGSILMESTQRYGARGRFDTKYTMTNFNMTIHLQDQEVYSALPITFTSSETSYVSEDNYFHLEFYKVAANKFMVVLGNTMAHNVSISEWNKESAGAYTGRYIESLSNMFNISAETDFETGKTTIRVNNESVVIDTYRICDPSGNGAATEANAPSEDINATITIGTMGGTDNRAYNLVVSMMDEDYQNYLSTRDEVVKQAKTRIEEAAKNIPEELTDDTVGNYRATYSELMAALTNSDGLESYDFNKYLEEVSTEATNKATQVLEDYDAKVEVAKQEVRDMLNEYAEEDYDEEGWAEIETIKNNVESILAELDIIGSVNEAKETIKASLDAVLTRAQKEALEELKAYKETKKAELQTYADLDNIEDTSLLREVANLVSEGKTAIDAALNEDEVDTTLNEYKGKIDAKKADYAAAKALAERKEEVLAQIDELEASIDFGKYSAENQTTIKNLLTAARNAVEECETIEALNTLYDNLVSEIAAIAQKSSGCGGSIVATSALLSVLALSGAAFISIKKKED